MEKSFNFNRPVFFPTLSRKAEKGRWQESIGLTDWSTRVHSHEDKKVDIHWKDYAEIIFLKGHEDIEYELIETDREVIIRYYWKDFDKTLLEDDEDEC